MVINLDMGDVIVSFGHKDLKGFGFLLQFVCLYLIQMIGIFDSHQALKW